MRLKCHLQAQTTLLELRVLHDNQVPVCFTGNIPAFNTQKDWVRQALIATWQAESGLNFTFRDCPTSGSTPYLMFALKNGPNGGASGFGMETTFKVPGPGVEAGTEIQFSASTSRQAVEWNAVHETGHALGFHHEWERADRSSATCNPDAIGLTEGAVLGPYDKASVMGYEFDQATEQPSPCRAGLAGGALSALDKQGIADLYARPGTQLLGITGGALKHVIRRMDGWGTFGDVEGETGSIGDIVRANAAYTKRGSSNVVVLTSGGGMFLVQRAASGIWGSAVDVRTKTGFTGTFQEVSVTDIDGFTHILGISPAGSDKNLMHSLRNPAGSYSAFGNVEGAAPVPPAIGTPIKVGSANVAGELHVCVVTSNNRLWHTVRQVSGNWLAFGDVELAAGGDKGAFTDVDCTSVGGNLHLVGITTAGGIWHTVRKTATNNWTSWGNVKSLAGTPSVAGDTMPLSVSTSQWGGKLYVGVRIGSKLLQARRDGDTNWNNLTGSSWTGWTNANNAAGNFNFTSLGSD